MSVGRWLSQVFGGTPVDDPMATLDASFQEQSEALQQSRRGVADVVTARKRVELQLRSLQAQVDRLGAMAQAEVDADREDAARELLVRRAGVLEQLALLEPDAARLGEQEDRLQAQVQHLEATVEAFRAQRETARAQRSAAQAHTRIVAAQAGLSQESADVGLALQQARAQTEALQARADAAEELTRPGGALPWESAGESAQRQVAAMTREAARTLGAEGVEAELARLRAHRTPPS